MRERALRDDIVDSRCEDESKVIWAAVREEEIWRYIVGGNISSFRGWCWVGGIFGQCQSRPPGRGRSGCPIDLSLIEVGKGSLVGRGGHGTVFNIKARLPTDSVQAAGARQSARTCISKQRDSIPSKYSRGFVGRNLPAPIGHQAEVKR